MVEYFLMAVAASALMAGGLLMMKARAANLPVAGGLQIPAAMLAWLTDPIWTTGLLTQTLGFAFYIAAIAHLPISIVAIMMQGGIAMFVMFSVAMLGERATTSEWIGIAAVVVAIAVLSFSMGADAESGGINVRALATIVTIALTVAIGAHLSPSMRASGIAAAVASGMAFGLGSLFAKGMTDTIAATSSVAMLINAVEDPFVWATIAANLAGLILLQNAFHTARGIIALPISSALSNVVPIVGGVIAFDERLPTDPLAAAMRVTSFALTIAASALLARAQAGAPAAQSPPTSSSASA